ncbi:MAG: radical SAM protein [Firmicutes bacterium]|nr:radical SAM protein [Bacillota bacterium]
MKISFLTEVGYRLLSYKSQSIFGVPRTKPLSLTVSITQKCNSKCKTCNIWKDPRNKQPNNELAIDEYDKIFESIGRSVIWYTLSGGEPFLRKDIVEIAKLIIKYSAPKVIIIPTNGLLVDRIFRETENILKILPHHSTLIVNISLDGIGENHDEIRGIPGNFKKFLETFAALKELKKTYNHSFELGVHSVVSRFNVENILELFDYVKNNLSPDSYICEIAENREELLNTEDDITPAIDLYEKTIRPLQHELRESLLHNKGITGLIQAFRLKYYDYVITEMREKRRVIPCYAGRVSAQISPWGDVWPCCILAYQADMGNLREFGHDFNRLWYSEKAAKVRNQVFKGDCYCPMANVHYTNMVLTPKAMIGVMKNCLGARVGAK